MNATQLKIFFDGVRSRLFKGGLSEPQVKTIDAIVAFWYQNYPDRFKADLAYILATAYWETFPDMFPNRERGGDKYLWEMYDIQGKRPNKARELGNLSPGDGVRYAGKGLAHVTGRDNYRRVDRRFGTQTEKYPEQMLTLEVAVPVLVVGMVEGMFTGVELREVIQRDTETLEEFLDDRAIINGKDKALEIAKIAVKFQAAILEGLDPNNSLLYPADQPTQATRRYDWEPPSLQEPAKPDEYPVDYAPAQPAEKDLEAFRQWKRETAQKKYDEEYRERNSKPLIQSTVTRAILGGAFAWVGAKYGLDIPPEYRDLAENVILSSTASLVMWGRWKADTVISGIFGRRK